MISHNYSPLRVLVALGQALFATATLYRARGSQLSQFGYAAFGLTVASYAVMSVVNLLGGIFSPDYPTMYLAESSVMAEARSHGGHIEGAVGVLQEQPISFQNNESDSCTGFQSALTFEDSSNGDMIIRADSDYTATVLESQTDQDTMDPTSVILILSCPPLVTKSKFFIKDPKQNSQGR